MVVRPAAVQSSLSPVSILALGTALPPRSFSQSAALAWGLDHVPMKSDTRELYRRVLSDGAIATRHFAVDDLAEILETDHDVVLARFERWAAALSATSLSRALEASHLDAHSVDFLAATTCTGYLCPGLTSYVMERAGLRADVRRVDLVGMGCGAALPALEQACHFLAAHPDGTAAVVSTEICSAAIFLGDAPDLVVSNAIFGDGSAAAILRRADHASAAPSAAPRPRGCRRPFRSA
jgi:predicted naringenin-chalcone synthase